MKTKIALKAIAIAVFLVFAVAGLQVVQVANANFFPGDALIIDSPIFKMVYTNTSVPLDVYANVANPTPEVVSITYCLDENSNVTLTNLTKTLRSPGHIQGSQFYAKILLENLAEGNHTLRAYSQDAIGAQMNWTVEFFVDTHYTSPLSVLSPQNITYTTPEVPLTFICRETNRLDGNFTYAAYVLDGIGSDYIYENATLTDLSIGNHTIDVTVWTDNYQFFSEKIYFTVSNQTPTASPIPSPSNSPTQQPTSSPTSIPPDYYGGGVNILPLILGTIALAIVVAIVVLVLLKKRGRLTK